MVHSGVLLLFCLPIAIQAQYGAPNTPVHTQTHPQTGCPWVTQGTAAKVLGGDVSVTVQMTNAVEGSCRFLRQNSSGSLMIHVSKSGVPGCTATGVRLRGIGNEATRCTVPGSRGEEVETIQSRVRDLYFNVTRSLRKEKASAKATDLQNDTLEQVAETIAGNLY